MIALIYSLETQWQPFFLHKEKKNRGNKCPECYIKAERRMYCPCDNFSLSQELVHNYKRKTFCETIMPNCVEK